MYMTEFCLVKYDPDWRGMMHIHLDSSSELQLYKQLVNQLIEHIAMGKS